MKKYIIGFAIGVFFLFTTAVIAVTSFRDAQPGDWFYDAVSELARIGVIAGYSDGTFRPGEKVTRGEVAVMLNRFKEFVDANYGPFVAKELNKNNLDFQFELCHFSKTKDRVYKVTWNDGDGTFQGPGNVQDRWWDRNGKLLLSRKNAMRDRFTLPMEPYDLCIPIGNPRVNLEGFDTKEADLRFCPDSYGGDDESGPCMGEGCDHYVFVVNGQSRWTEEFNVPWVKEHCPNLNLPNSLR